MNHQAKGKKQTVYPPQDEQSDDLEDLQQQNSFEGENKIYELKSTIHTLQIQKNRLALQHQASLSSFESKNQQLTLQNNTLRRDNTKLQSSVKKLEDQNQQLRKINETYRHQIEGANRRTAEFHKSLQQNGLDPSELINEMMMKDKKILELTQQLKNRPNSSLGNTNQKINEADQQKLEQQVRYFKNMVDQLKKKEIAYKREYEGMLQSKQEIIKKMSNQNDEFSRKIAESKDKIISQLRKEHEQLQKKLQHYAREIETLTEKSSSNEKELAKVRAEYKRKEQSLLNHYESEKEDLAKGLNQKLRRHQKDKQQKLNQNQEKIYQLQGQIQILKQQLAKNKAEVVSLNQFNSYLETSSKQYEQAKKKLQTALYEKQKQIGEIRQSYFTQISELKKALIVQRSQIDQKATMLEQQLLTKNGLIQKYEQQIYEIQRREEENARQGQTNLQKQLERIQKQKQHLSQDYETLQERYRQKSEKLLNVEKKFKKEYEERITGLQTQLLKEKQNAKLLKKDSVNMLSTQKNQSNNQQIQKLININELRKIQVEEKQKQIKRLNQQKYSLQRQNGRIKQDLISVEKKLKQKTEDYRNLQGQFDELSQKYRKGVKELQLKMEQMGQQIIDEKRKAEKRKNEAVETQKTLSAQVKQYKIKIKQLQQELGEYKNKKVEDAQYTDLKLQKLAHQISLVKKQKESAMLNHERKTKQKEEVLVQQKNKLLQYIEQLEENNEILNKKVGMLQSKDRKNANILQKQLRQVKFEYSESLKEINSVLQKYKKLEQIHREMLGNFDNLKQEKDILNQKYVDLYKQKNKLIDEINSAYDQINKLNLVLMSKQEQLSRSKTINCPHFESKPRIYTTTSNLSQVPQGPRYSNMAPSMTKSPLKYYDKSESFYSNHNQNSKYSRY